jgi:Ca-activated chloride channel family protein
MPMTESTTADPRQPAGLLAAGAPVPLEGVAVEATVTGVCARVTIAQRYRNREPQPIEAVYVFPLDEGAAVCGFEAVSAGVHYVGEVMPRDEAFRIYDDALMAGHSAYLLDEERPDVFTASIGNVPPGGEVLIQLTYVTELPLDGEAVRFTLPTTVSPRYAPAEDRAGVGRSQDDALNPPRAWTVPYGLELRVSFEMPGAITRLESPSHPLSIALDGTRATVTLGQARAALDRDVVVLVEAAGLTTPHAILERDSAGRHTAALVFRPVFDVEQAPSEVIFVVDRSGSMGGTSIAEVRNTLQLCLRSLLPGSRFDVVGFGTTFTSVFGGCVAYDEATLARAAEHVAALEADLGGTEILPALRAVLERPRSELPRQVVLLTDGEVTNTDEVIALVGRHAAHTRVFTVGIGHGASTHLIRGVARAGHGTAEFIAPGERAEAKVLRHFARVLAPAITDVTVEWGGLDVRMAPTQPPAVFAGDRVVIYGWPTEMRAAMATLSGRSTRGRVSFEVGLDPERAMAGTTLAALAARARIRELEDSPGWVEARGSRQADRRGSQVTDEIVQLALAHGLASRETSFVAVERRETPVEGELALRRIPVALTSGWGGLDQAMPPGPHAMMRAMPAASLLGGVVDSAIDGVWPMARGPRVAGSRRTSAASSGLARASKRVRDVADAMLGRAGGADAERSRDGGAERPLDRVVPLQRADGSWELTEAFAAAIGMELAQLHAALPDAGGAGDVQRAWATALALAWLARHAADARDEWRLLARKAQQWLTAAGGGADTQRARQRAAEALVAG